MACSLGALWHLGKEVVFLETEWGLNHEPKASDAEDLSTPPTWHVLLD